LQGAAKRHHSSRSCDQSFCFRVYEGEDRRTILHLAWERESEAWTELLLSGGEGVRKRADPCKEDGSGYESTHWAVRSNRARVVEILKESGACLDIRDRKEGLTPLIMALRLDVNAPMVMRLLNLGADWATKDEEGKDAIFYAIGAGDLMAAGYFGEGGRRAVEGAHKVGAS
jgi:hypothetical protein